MKKSLLFLVLVVGVLFLAGCAVEELEEGPYSDIKIASATLDDGNYGTDITAYCLNDYYGMDMEFIHQGYAGGRTGGSFTIDNSVTGVEETSGVLEEGDSYITNDDGLRIDVTGVTYQDYAGGLKLVSFDLVCNPTTSQQQTQI